MTIREIAESVNKTDRAIRNWANKVAEKDSVMAEKITAGTSTYPADFTLDETLAIIQKGLGKNAAAMYAQNASHSNAGALPKHQTTDIDKLVGLVEMLVKTVTQMNPTVTNGNQLVIPEVLPEVTHMTLTGYSRVNNLQLSEGDKRSAGMVLRGICNQRNLVIKPIPDQHYGRVNSYPVEILDEYYTP